MVPALFPPAAASRMSAARKAIEEDGAQAIVLGAGVEEGAGDAVGTVAVFCGTVQAVSTAASRTGNINLFLFMAVSPLPFTYDSRLCSRALQPSYTSRQVASKSPVYQGSATSPGRVVYSSRAWIFPAGSPPQIRVMLRRLA